MSSPAYKLLKIEVFRVYKYLKISMAPFSKFIHTSVIFLLRSQDLLLLSKVYSQLNNKKQTTGNEAVKHRVLFNTEENLRSLTISGIDLEMPMVSIDVTKYSFQNLKRYIE